MTEFYRARPRYLYKVNPRDLREVLVKYNKTRARWRHHSYYGTPEQASAAITRLTFAEYDRREQSR